MYTAPTWRVVMLAVFLIIPGRSAAALDLDQAEQLALERDPALHAFDQRIAAARALAVAKSALPDPELILGAQGVPVDEPLSADMMTQYRIGFRQRIPTRTGRTALRRTGEHQSVALDAGMQARKLELLRETRRAWVDWAAALKSLQLARTSRSAFEDLLAITEARYRAGTGRQHDINQALLELALLDQRIQDRLTVVEEAAARLKRWTGVAPGQNEHPEFPGWHRPENANELEQKLASHPEITALEERVAQGQAQVELARSAYRPEWMIEAGYAHTRGIDPMTHRSQSDKLFAMVSFSLPLFTANRQDRRLDAARAEREARSQDITAKLHELRGELDRQLQLWKNHEQRLASLEQNVLDAAEQTVTAILASYRSDRASFDEVVRARLTLLEQKLAAIELRREQSQAAVEVIYLAAEVPL